MQFALNDSLDWAVSKRQLLYVNAQGEFSPVQGKQVIVREDNEAALGICGAGYEPFQNEDLKQLVAPMLSEGTLTVANRGLLSGGKKVFIQCQMAQDFQVIGETYKGFLTLLNSFDGSTSVAVGQSMIRVVCGNTFAASYSGLSEKFRHTAGVTDRVLSTKSVIDFVNSGMRVYAANVEKMAATPLSAGQFQRAVEQIYRKKVADLKETTVESLNRLFYKGAGNEGKTAYDAFNAITDLNSHSRKTEAGNFYYANFGRGASLNRRAMEVLGELVAA